MSTPTHTDILTPQDRKLLRDLDRFLNRSGKVLSARYPEEAARAVHRDTLQEYRRLIPHLPDIGGKANHLYNNLVQSAWALALYRAVQRQGGAVEEAGELIHRAMEAVLYRIPAFLRHVIGRLRLSRWRVRRLQAAARRSQRRQYPGDWVFEIIEGDGRAFDLGIDYIECAIDKFMRAQDAPELTPYLCNIDYLLAHAFGFGLRRTMTLAWGCPKCDFRMTRASTTPEAWPPRFVERDCGASTPSSPE